MTYTFTVHKGAQQVGLTRQSLDQCWERLQRFRDLQSDPPQRFELTLADGAVITIEQEKCR